MYCETFKRYTIAMTDAGGNVRQFCTGHKDFHLTQKEKKDEGHQRGENTQGIETDKKPKDLDKTLGDKTK